MQKSKKNHFSSTIVTSVIQTHKIEKNPYVSSDQKIFCFVNPLPQSKLFSKRSTWHPKKNARFHRTLQGVIFFSKPPAADPQNWARSGVKNLSIFPPAINKLISSSRHINRSHSFTMTNALSIHQKHRRVLWSPSAKKLSSFNYVSNSK